MPSSKSRLSQQPYPELQLTPPPTGSAMKFRPIIISGPSGVGKGTLIQMLHDKHPGLLTKTVSHTTRQPRQGEIEGENYFFISKSKFRSLISKNAFVEYTYFSGNYYGTTKQTIKDQTAKGMMVVLEIDIEGVKQMRKATDIDASYVFIKPPSFEELETRLRNRSTETEESIEQRLQQAKQELEQADTPGLYDMVLVNEDIAVSYRD
ncbi:guanylate kinase domain-containing protein [Trichoderma breve]|uniref:guanylate kinase n=1 Tax=Trichoderma breve TaxID=2034170 RepID=A0A9W9JSH5_9HYPO|nr:guanylate kinase domain-containing protein [Trichoderma breve]KAJ4865603.1 guanylate kinase domain-containing protein [Trichoderma breve]